MLTEVRIENFKGLRQLTLDLRFSQTKAPGGYKESEFLTFLDDGINKSNRVVPALGIFGPNASGKSSILTAVRVLKDIVTRSFTSGFFFPNKLNSDSETVKTSALGLTFCGLQKRFDYDIQYDASGIVKEILKIDGHDEFLVRNGSVEFLSEKLTAIADALTSEFNTRCICCESNSQVRSMLDCLHEEFPGIGNEYHFTYEFIDRRLFILPSGQESIENALTLLVHSSDGNSIEEKKKDAVRRITDILRKLDTGIETFDFQVDSERLEKIRIRTYRKNDRDEFVSFELFGEESAGVQRLFVLIPLFLWAASSGKTIFIDELETSLHPLLLTTLVEIFKLKRSNKNRAQIVFTTNCTDLLENELLKLSEVALVDRRGFGGKQIMKLSEVPKLRNVNDFRRRYLRGDFGGIPFAS